jgi:hypothetical protein
VAIRTLPGMNDSTRFEITLPAQRRRELDELAVASGLSVADLMRLATARLLANPGALLKPPAQDAA